MKPYPGNNLTDEQRIFNYRLSRARRTIENAFGILVAKWKILQTRIDAQPKVASKIVLAAVALHNYCLYTGGRDCRNVPENFVDVETGDAAVEGGWRDYLHGGSAGRNVEPLGGGGNATQRAARIRDRLRRFFVEDAPLEWQEEYIAVGRGFYVE